MCVTRRPQLATNCSNSGSNSSTHPTNIRALCCHRRRMLLLSAPVGSTRKNPTGHRKIDLIFYQMSELHNFATIQTFSQSSCKNGMTHSWRKAAATAIASDNHTQRSCRKKVATSTVNRIFSNHLCCIDQFTSTVMEMLVFAAIIAVTTGAITSSGSRQKRHRQTQASMNLLQLPPQPHSVFSHGGICPQGEYS